MNTGLVNTRTTHKWDAHPLWEYQLLVHPDEKVNEQVKDEKRYFVTAYGHEVSIETNQQVLVASFFAPEEIEPTLLRWTQKVCNNQPRFVTTLNNFSGFPPNTIYLRVQNHQPYKELVKGLKAIEQYVQSNECPSMNLVSAPHIIMARSLPEVVYEKAVKDYAGRLFHASFSVEKLLLIKRKHQREAFQNVSLFPLAAQPNDFFN